jgi:hypothetical protein
VRRVLEWTITRLRLANSTSSSGVKATPSKHIT